MFEVDLELIAFDGGDGAVAELAVEDALAEFGVTLREAPATPTRIWQALQEARKRG